MTGKRIITLILINVFLACLCAQELKIKNNTTIPITTTITVKENKDYTDIQSGSIEHEVQSVVIQPAEEIIVTLDKKKFNDAIFLIQGTSITAPPVVPLASNECMLSGYSGEISFTQKNSTLTCSITQTNADYSTLSKRDKKLFDMAEQAAPKAYAPYSKLYAGSALETERGNIFTGCNVENASYGSTNCAERTAVFNAVTHEGSNMKIKTIVVLFKDKAGKLLAGCSCGMCLQVIKEFSTVETRVICHFNDKIIIKSFKDIFPEILEK